MNISTSAKTRLFSKNNSSSKSKNFRYREFTTLLPSILTVLTIGLGFSAIRFALNHQSGIAIILISLAALFDGLDGRFARLLKSESELGVQLDSLADAINFGVAPALIIYLSLLNYSASGWICVLIYTTCIVLRLARFNAISGKEILKYEKDFFVGMPAPAGAITLILPLSMRGIYETGWWTNQIVVQIWVLIVAMLVISRIPTYSFKTINLPVKLIPIILISLVLLLAVALTFPYILYFILLIPYLMHIPFAYYSKRWISSRPETWQIEPAERKALRKQFRQQRRSSARLWLRRPH